MNGDLEKLLIDIRAAQKPVVTNWGYYQSTSYPSVTDVLELMERLAKDLIKQRGEDGRKCGMKCGFEPDPLPAIRPETEDVLRSGGQTHEYGPRPRIATARPQPK
jgi:hypothetical protein